MGRTVNRARFDIPPGARIPKEWERSGRATTAEFNAWQANPEQSKPTKVGKRNAEGGFCSILGHRYRSKMEQRWGLYLRALGYQLWTDKESPPPADGGRYYRYEGRAWEFPGIKGANYRYTPDYECWPALPDPLTPRTALLPYVVYEVKGWMDDTSTIRLKRMAKFFPTVPIVVVDSDLFDQYTHGAAGVVPGWDA